MFLLHVKKQRKCVFYEMLEIAAKYNGAIPSTDEENVTDDELTNDEP